MVVKIEGQTYYDTEEINNLVNSFRGFAIQWLQRNGNGRNGDGAPYPVHKMKTPGCTLTQREIEVLALVAEGCFNKEIASRLNLSEQTIKNHMTTIMQKLNADSRTEATTIAIKYGLIPLS